MAVDFPSVGLLDGGRSFDGAALFGDGAAVAETAAGHLVLFGFDVGEGNRLLLPLAVRIRNRGEQQRASGWTLW